LIDVHTNGAGDALFNRDQGNAVAIASVEYARCGATGFLAGIMTAPFESMLHAAYEIVESAHQLDEHGVRGARCLGIHFEGPFLNPKFRRVHRLEWLATASAERAREMVDACMGACVLVTMAPAVEGAADALRVIAKVCAVSRWGFARGRTRATACRRWIIATRRSSLRSFRTGVRSCS
jgi:N-acetylglucosamine-6-phosphate deacetylase